MHRYFVYIIIALVSISCYQNNNKLSFISINLDNIKDSDSNVDIDSLTLSLLNKNADLIELRKDNINHQFYRKISNKNYFTLLQDSSSEEIGNSILFVNKNLLDLLVTSQHVIKSNMLNQNQNVISWYKFKYIKSGYIFYVFTLNTQSYTDDNQTKLIAFNLLNKINEVSSGAPVIILNNEFSNKEEMNQYITNKWIDNYNFNAINNKGKCCVKFFINDFFKIKTLEKDSLDPASYCNIHVRFSLNMKAVKKNLTGNELSELIIK